MTRWYRRDKGPRLTSPEFSRLESNLLYLLLLRAEKYSFLPDLFNALNENVESMIRMMHSFAGTTITFPAIEKLEEHTDEIKVYLRLRNISQTPLNVASRWSETVKQLSREYSIDDVTVLAVFNRIHELAKEAGIYG